MSSSIISIKQALKGLLQDMENSSKFDNQHVESVLSTMLTTGYTDIDEEIGSFSPGELVVIGGVPSSGKTSFLFNIAENIAIHKKQSVLILSLESNIKRQALRFLASLGRININSIIRNRMTDEDWPRMATAVRIIADIDINFLSIKQDSLESTIQSIEKAIIETSATTLCIDPIQNIKDLQETNKAAELSNISRELKELAIRNNILVLVTSHLSRTVFSRPNKRPIAQDILGSGSIEHDADYVILIYRDEIFYPDTEFKGIAEINFAKYRFGRPFSSRLCFFGKYLRFENYIPYDDI